MSAWISIRDEHGELVFSKKIGRHAGCVLEYGVKTERGTGAEASWTYNYDGVWNEIDWNPIQWLKENNGCVKADANVVAFLFTQLLRVHKLPDQNRDRLASERPSTNDLFDATPLNAAGMLVWILTWLMEPGAASIWLGLH
ncbi:MAG: hypothetical protein M1352_01525 [Patescibacteria group bacterium]|nr:hypothetical protein [Patescibacteria group bacterium]